MGSIFKRSKWLFYNFITMIINLFIKRDEDIWLFGSWMGQRFADNSRYLFQFLYANKKKYNFKNIVWVTTNDILIKELREMNYNVYNSKSIKGIFYHFKSGNHVICNMPDKTGKYTGDIYGRFSYGAKKIQLWHGLGIKAVGNKRRDVNNENALKQIMRRISDYQMFNPGGWNNCYWLVTSPISEKIAIEDNGVSDLNKIIMGNYPRFCTQNIKLTKYELEVIDRIRMLKNENKKIVFYLPTFRNNYDHYVEPISNKQFLNFLHENSIIWIEKKHLADKSNIVCGDSNVIYLEPALDVNAILSEVDELVTDYSSVVVDAVLQDKKTTNYIPDFEYYRDQDRGFIADFGVCNPGEYAKSLGELENLLLMSNIDFFSETRVKKYQNTKNTFIGNNPIDLDWIFKRIQDVINS